MRDRLLAWTSGLGAALAAACCLTPLLPWALAGLGFGAMIPYVYRDLILIPIAIGFLILMGFALWRMKRHNRS